jgi:polyisoprenoid-binding protein YceI
MAIPSRIRRLASLSVLVVLLLAACAPAQSPSSNPAQIPVTAATATDASAPTQAVSAPATAYPAAATPGTPAPAGGTGAGLKYVIDASKSQASYAVREQLARLNLPSDAVGKTSSISGAVVLNADGTIDSSNSKITVNLSTLQTDSSMRDNFVRQNILQTGQYPNAIFVPTQVSGLPASLPQSGSLTFKVTGDLTIRNVTKSVTWDVTGTVTNGVATGTATVSFTFEDFNLNQPQVPVVLSVVDKITLTVNVTLQAQ